ncbi:MAG: hypothetical protein ABJE95_23240 [Byssovorax sp.]
MRRNLALYVILVAELGVAALGLFFHLRSRAAIAGAFAEFNTAMPAYTALALAPWFLPLALAVAAALSLVAIAAPLRRSRRMTLAGTGLILASSAVCFAIVASFLPIFQPG